MSYLGLLKLTGQESKVLWTPSEMFTTYSPQSLLPFIQKSSRKCWGCHTILLRKYLLLILLYGKIIIWTKL